MSNDGWEYSEEGDLDPDLTDEAGYREWQQPDRRWAGSLFRIVTTLLLIALIGSVLVSVLSGRRSSSPPEQVPNPGGRLTRPAPTAFPELRPGQAEELMADYNKPLPQATPETQEFWDGLKRAELRIQQCQDCQQHYFYPRPFCPHCHSTNVEWVTASGKGTLETFVINHRAMGGFADEVPYVIAVVTLEEGPRMMTNLVNIEADPEHVAADMAVEIVYDAVTDEVTLPKFQPAS